MKIRQKNINYYKNKSVFNLKMGKKLFKEKTKSDTKYVLN